MTGPSHHAAAEARTLLSLRRYDDAAATARRGLGGDPDNAELLGLLASALDAAEHHHDAREMAERALAIDPRQAWIHNVRAWAILNGAGRPADAVAAARTAAKMEPNNVEFRYTLTCALCRARNRSDAAVIAASMRKLDPTSPLGPLAQAIVELTRVRIFEIKWWWAVIAILITRGFILVIWAVYWVVVALMRRGPLRRADAHLVEALRLDPGDAHTLALTAQVAQLRFRFLQSLDAGLAAGMIDSGMVKADDLARAIVRRLSAVATVVFILWWMAFAMFSDDAAWTPLPACLGVAGVVLVGWLDWLQTSRLPAGVVRNVRRRWSFPVLITVLAALSLLAATSSAHGVSWTVVACLPGIAAAVCAVILAAQWRAAR